MKLIFIYGPPASGKLTIAKELSKLTGFKVFHNHLTVDLVVPFFGFTQAGFDLASHIRLKVFEEAAKQNIKGLIFTYVFANNKDDTLFIKQSLKSVEKYKGKICFVQLQCHEEELFKRVKHPSRKAFRKIQTIKRLRYSLTKNDLHSPVPFGKQLSINTTQFTSKQVALKIKKEYRL
ncbi:MAG: AAA family ATPase [Candidatus Nanoarchaeia archaeon]